MVKTIKLVEEMLEEIENLCGGETELTKKARNHFDDKANNGYCPVWLKDFSDDDKLKYGIPFREETILLEYGIKRIVAIPAAVLECDESEV